MIIMRPTGPTNPATTEIAAMIRKDYPVVARHLLKSRRAKEGVNVEKISRSSRDNEAVIVPGTCLGTGKIERKVTVYALRFSDSARKKIEDNGGKCLPLSQLAKDKPKGRMII